ncbi:hypothetical protein Y032_0034g2893 [Ancylostoma ceylanicum]|uniref:Uncharacterized protein n=1 Tax=Ancylostoma ceylanicum TaxID=53326 RepID=A0A016ULJ1_9BILA|nr:hypothetical protein Y032_0034g2893 [Ancylostoma ceylanicum]
MSPSKYAIFIHKRFITLMFFSQRLTITTSKGLPTIFNVEPGSSFRSALCSCALLRVTFLDDCFSFPEPAHKSVVRNIH